MCLYSIKHRWCYYLIQKLYRKNIKPRQVNNISCEINTFMKQRLIPRKLIHDCRLDGDYSSHIRTQKSEHSFGQLTPKSTRWIAYTQSTVQAHKVPVQLHGQREPTQPKWEHETIRMNGFCLMMVWEWVICILVLCWWRASAFWIYEISLADDAKQPPRVWKRNQQFEGSALRAV